jgi:hypothetical protein
MSDEKKKRSKRKDPRIECEYFEDIEVVNPKTGEKTIQKVKVTRYKAAGGPKELGNKGVSEEIEEGLKYTHVVDLSGDED